MTTTRLEQRCGREPLLNELQEARLKRTGWTRRMPLTLQYAGRQFFCSPRERPGPRYAELYGIAPESIQPGTSLGMEAMAKGVETEKQLELIRAEGCTEVQGFYFSPPRPADELAPFLGSGVEMMRPGRSGFIRRA
jgi:predicted signal transduction protein with EAL and GGDEF domain